MTTEERLDRVERNYRRWKCVTIVLVIGLISCLALSVWSNWPRPRDAISARSFVLMDENGERRGEVCTVESAAALQFVDGNGEPRVTLGITSCGDPILLLKDDQGKLRAEFSLLADGSPRMNLLDEEGNMLSKLP